MNRPAIRRAMAATFRALAAELPADEWQALAREIAADFFRLTNHSRSPSGMYKFRPDDDEPTKPENPEAKR